MSSADRCRVALPSRISRIFRRGSVTFKPALRRSLPSTRTLRRSAAAETAGDPRSGMIARMIILHRARLRLPLAAFAALVLLAATLTGCVYRMNIQQGNYLAGKTVDQLQVGMTRSQVRYLLGTPMVPAVFDKDRWDYVYYFKHGRLRRPEERHLIVFFAQDKVSRFDRENVTPCPGRRTQSGGAPRVCAGAGTAGVEV